MEVVSQSIPWSSLISKPFHSFQNLNEPEWTQDDHPIQLSSFPLTNHSSAVWSHLKVILSFLCLQTTSECKQFSFDYRLTLVSGIPLGPAWTYTKVWGYLVHPEVRLGWARGMSLEWRFWSFSARLSLKWWQNEWNDVGMRFSFNNRSLGNGCRMMHFLVLASFRGRTKKDEGGRNEKSGMVFYGEYGDNFSFVLKRKYCWNDKRNPTQFFFIQKSMQYNQSNAMFANFFIHILASEEEGREKMAQPQQPKPPSPKFTMIDSKGEEFLQVCSFKAILFKIMMMKMMFMNSWSVPIAFQNI